MISRTRILSYSIMLYVGLCCGGAIAGQLKTHSMFSSNMVIQRDKPIVVWGWAETGQKVSVKFGEEKAEATAGGDKGRTIDAELLRVEGNTAIVIKGDKEMRLPLQVLSEPDKQFVADWSAKQKQTPATVAASPNAAAMPAPSSAKPASSAKPTPTPAAATPKANDKPAPAAKPAQPASNEPYYAVGKTPIFLPFPDVTDKKPWIVKNLGPVGIGITLIRPGMTMQINNVEKGSPAEATGKLSKGQIIESINGKVLKEIDPRIILGDIITQAEATDGKVALKIKDVGEVVVNIPVMGAYSKTWPVNCPKTDKIVRNLADILAREKDPSSWGSVLFLLSTGEEKDLEVVRRWMQNFKMTECPNWHRGMLGPAICEYYLRTGDPIVLPMIKQMVERLRVNMFIGGWSAQDAPASYTYSVGSGHLHAAGVHCMTLLVMAKLCGVEVDDKLFNETFAQFYRFAGHGNVAYGNGLPEGGFRDNGKSSGLAHTLGAAALLSSEGESSIFAKARDNTAAKAFYANSWFHASHTGGGLGEVWHHAAVSLMREKWPVAYRSYLDSRRWMMDLSRRFDGSIGVAGMFDRYDVSATESASLGASAKPFGNYLALTYTYPRKQLQLFGAPRSKWAKTITLSRPWGNEADDAFHSTDPIPGGPLTSEELQNEKVETDASLAVFAKLADPALTDKTLLKYIHHPEYEYRSSAMDQIVKRGRVELVPPLLKSSDPRLRQAGLLAMTGMFKGSPFPVDKITPEMWELAGKIVEDPNESWWVAKHAIDAMGRGPVDLIAKHRKRLMELLNHDCVWVQNSAVQTLSKICVLPDHYKTVLPVIIDKTVAFRVVSASRMGTQSILEAMKTASPEVKEFAMPLLQKTYVNIPDVIKEPYNNAVMSNCAKTLRSLFGSLIQTLPGGQEFVMTKPITRLESFKSGKNSDMYTYSGTFTPNPEVLGIWNLAVTEMPNKPEEIDARIDAYVKYRSSGKSTNQKPPKDVMEFRDKGDVRSRYFKGYFWSGNMLLSTDEDQAVKFEIRKRDGYEFLVVERGGFQTPTDVDQFVVPKDWHCGYHVYVKQK